MWRGDRGGQRKSVAGIARSCQEIGGIDDAVVVIVNRRQVAPVVAQRTVGPEVTGAVLVCLGMDEVVGAAGTVVSDERVQMELVA